MLLLQSCQSLPQLFTSVEDVADDTAIKTEVSREALQNGQDIDVKIKIRNVKK